MTRPTLKVFGLDDATCDDRYTGAQTATQPPKLTVFSPNAESKQEKSAPNMVQVRLADVLDAVQNSTRERLRWIEDFREDPISITQDFYDVIVAFQRLRKSA